MLHEDTESLDEVVVIGYGTQKKSDLTGSVTSIKAESLKGLVSGNASEALQGKSGVYVTNPRTQIKRHPRKEIVYDNGMTNFSSADVCLSPTPTYRLQKKDIRRGTLISRMIPWRMASGTIFFPE